MRLQVSLTLPREAVSVPLVRNLVATTLERAGVTPDCVEDVKVAVSEACTNAYEHAQSGDTYEVAVTLDDELVSIDVIDRGPGIPALPPADIPASPPSDAGASLPDLEQEGGRGIDLIRAMTEAARFESVRHGGGVVHMWKRLEWVPDAPMGPSSVSRDGKPH